MNNEREVLLRVEHLCQYFKMGKRELKAVDDVSFDIYRGEVFGLVGESGCGKTTTGRSIIRLYNITSGDVYFKGQRIGAGIRASKDAIKQAKIDYKNGKIDDEAYEEILTSKTQDINKRKRDQKYCDSIYAEQQAKIIKEKYNSLKAKLNPKALDYQYNLAELIKQEKNELRRSKRLTTQIQMIFQDPIASLNPRMTVQEIISEGLVIQGEKDKAYIQEKVYEILELVGLVKEHATRYPHEFSGGQRQRIGIARSVIMRPEMIIADEPISALDVSIQAQVINLLNELREKLGLTIMFIAHDLSVVKYFSDRIGVMYYGKLVELTTSEELFDHPLHPYTRSLLSAIPLPDPVYEKKRVRIAYNPLAEHDYSVDKPSLREIKKGHFVYCNDAEEKRYKEQLANE